MRKRYLSTAEAARLLNTQSYFTREEALAVAEALGAGLERLPKPDLKDGRGRPAVSQLALRNALRRAVRVRPAAIR